MWQAGFGPKCITKKEALMGTKYGKKAGQEEETKAERHRMMRDEQSQTEGINTKRRWEQTTDICEDRWQWTK